MKKDSKQAMLSQCLFCCLTVIPALLLSPSLSSAQNGAPAATAKAAPGERDTSRTPREIQSIDDADRVLAEAARRRSEVEQNFATEQRECSQRFFVASCLERAEERRRIALKPLRTMEADANIFKRRYRVDQRDRSLERKQSKEREEQSSAGAPSGTVIRTEILSSPNLGVSDIVTSKTVVERKMRRPAGSPSHATALSKKAPAWAELSNEERLAGESDAFVYARDRYELEQAERAAVSARLSVP